MIDYIVQGIKFLMELWGLLSDETKEDLKARAADQFSGPLREYYRSATSKVNQA